jgi:hypothetical protein
LVIAFLRREELSADDHGEISSAEPRMALPVAGGRVSCLVQGDLMRMPDIAEALAKAEGHNKPTDPVRLTLFLGIVVLG